MKREAINHTKMDRLMRRLNIPRCTAVGLLEMLWNFTARECPTGLLANRTPEDIAIACGWTKDEAKLVDALEQSRWLDRTDEGLVIHDWSDHCDNSVHLKLWKERQFFHNGKPPKIPSSDLNSNVRKQYDEWVNGAATIRHGAPVGPILAMPILSEPCQATPETAPEVISQPTPEPSKVTQMRPVTLLERDTGWDQIREAWDDGATVIPGEGDWSQALVHWRKLSFEEKKLAVDDRIEMARMLKAGEFHVSSGGLPQNYLQHKHFGRRVKASAAQTRSRPKSKQDQIADAFAAVERNIHAGYRTEP